MLSLASSDHGDKGTHSFNIKLTIGDPLYASRTLYQFNFDVILRACDGSLFALQLIADQTYEIGSTTLQIQPDTSMAVCGNVPTTYAYTSAPPAPWLSFSTTNAQLSIYTLDPNDERLYFITIEASVSAADYGGAVGLTDTKSFFLDVTNLCE